MLYEKISSSSFGLSHSLPLGKQTIARLKTNNTQVFVYIIYENTRSPRLLRADLSRTLRIQTRALCKDCLDLLLTDALRGTGADLDLFWDDFSVLSLTAFPFFHSGILQKQCQGGNLLGNNKLLPRRSPFPCDRSSGVCKKEEVLKSASVWKSQ